MRPIHLIAMALLGISVIHLSCTQAQKNRVDRAAQTGQQIAETVRDVAEGGASLGVPDAGVVAVVASLLGTLLGVYNERRRGTVPLKTALTQVIQSVEEAFPERTDAQKSAMASVQDRSTQDLVRNIKGS